VATTRLTAHNYTRLVLDRTSAAFALAVAAGEEKGHAFDW
jgi:hypothetical protein